MGVMKGGLGDSLSLYPPPSPLPVPEVASSPEERKKHIWIFYFKNYKEVIYSIYGVHVKLFHLPG